MSNRNHVLRGTRVLEVGGEQVERIVRRYRMCSDEEFARFDGIVRLWNLDRSEDGYRIVLNYRFEMPPIK